MSIDDEIRQLVRTEVRAALGEMFQSDRRAAPRAKRARGGAPKRTCPVPGCPNGWTAANGGYCKDHLNTAGYKKWKAGHKAAKKR